MVLAGLASAASPLFAASTLAWLARRSRQQNEALRLQLDEAEANLRATERGFDAVMVLLGRATDCLDYIAVHGAHALRRWQSQLPEAPPTGATSTATSSVSTPPSSRSPPVRYASTPST